MIILSLIIQSDISFALVAAYGPGQLSRYSESLLTGRSWDLNPVEAIFSATVQAGPGVHPASCTMGTGSLLEVKRSWRGVDHPHQSSANVKEGVELHLYSLLGLRALFEGEHYPCLCCCVFQIPENQNFRGDS
jgi:hypothetical protein